MKATRIVKIGKVRSKHPEEQGLRYTGNSCCVECSKEASRKSYAGLDMTPAQKITTLLGEVARLKRALTDVRDAIQREYWDEYAGLDDARRILNKNIDGESA